MVTWPELKDSRSIRQPSQRKDIAISKAKDVKPRQALHFGRSMRWKTVAAPNPHTKDVVLQAVPLIQVWAHELAAHFAVDAAAAAAAAAEHPDNIPVAVQPWQPCVLF